MKTELQNEVVFAVFLNHFSNIKYTSSLFLPYQLLCCSCHFYNKEAKSKNFSLFPYKGISD